MNISQRDRQKGILCILTAGLFFSLMTFFVRLAGDVPTLQKTFFRNAMALIVSGAMLLRSGEGFHVKKNCRIPLLLRSTFGLMGVLFNFAAIDHLPIADANILNKLSPFFAIIFSCFLLKEKADKTEWLCVAAAFVGALFVIKPSGQMNFYALYGVLGGLGAGIAYTLVRVMGQRGERNAVIVFGFSAFSVLVLLPNLLFNFFPMTGRQWLFLLLAGTCAGGGQLAITSAYTYAPAREISVYDYSQILFAALLGFFFLGQLPDAYSLIGYVIIIGSAVCKWNYGRKKAA